LIRRTTSGLVGALLASTVVACSAGPTGGVLEPSATSTTLSGIPADVGRVVVVGIFVSAPPGSAGLTLDGARLVEPTGPIRLVGSMASTGRGESTACIGTGRTFPPRGCRLFALRGWTIPEEVVPTGFQIVLGLSVAREGTGSFPAVALTYHDDQGHRFVATLVQGAQVCAPMDAYLDAGCPGADDVQRRQSALVDR
jgi:hypothetical protein